MKTKTIKKYLALILTLITVASSLAVFAALPASAEEPTYDRLSHLKPGIMKFTESTESGYDFVATTETYDLCAYYIDLAYLLKDFDIDKFLEEYETGYVEIRNTNYNATVRYSTNGGENFSSEYPYKEVYGEDRYGDDMVREYLTKGLCKFSRDDKTAYEDLLTFGNMAIFVSAYKRPVVLNLMVTTESSIVFVKTIKIACGYPLDAIKSVDIYDFDFTGKHNATLDTDAWSNVGNVVSIKYLDENKKNERTSLVAGDKGYIEFTIAMIQNGIVMKEDGLDSWYWHEGYDAHWDTTVQSHLKGSSYSGVETDSSSFVTFDDRKYLIKLYHSYEIAEDAGKVIKQGTIKLTAPTDGAKPDASVSLSNIKSVVINRRSYPQFAAGNATWLKINSRGKLEAVKSFSAGTTYLALVKLKPYGNFYFDETSVKNLKVPGASKFTISYMRVGIDDYVKEDGYYLAATFPKVVKNTFDLKIGYDKTSVTATQGDKTYLTATASCDLTKATDVSVQWYYSTDPTKDPTGEICSASDGDLKLQLDTSTVGTGYYKCVISCKLDGKTSVVSYPDSEWVKLTVNAKAKDPFKITAVGKKDVVITSLDEDFSFEVSAKNASSDVKYVWQECDKNGKFTNASVLGDGQALLIYGMPESDAGKTVYYKCTATSGSETSSVVFSVKLEITYFDLTIKYAKTELKVEKGSKAELIAQANIDSMLVSNLNVVWYVADDASGKNEKIVSGANTPTLSAPTNQIGTKYYRCEISCVDNGQYSKLVYPSTKWVKVTVVAKGETTTTTKKPESSVKPETTTTKPDTTTKKPETTTTKPDTTTKKSDTTTKNPETTTTKPDTTTKNPDTTTKDPEVTTKTPEVTTNTPETSVNAPDTSTNTPAISTNDPATSSKEPETTTDQPSVTTKTPSTTDDTKKPTDPTDPTDNKDDSFPVWVIVLIGAVVVAAAAVAVVVVIMKKKHK